jgi:hypothetical protein
LQVAVPPLATLEEVQVWTSEPAVLSSAERTSKVVVSAAVSLLVAMRVGVKFVALGSSAFPGSGTFTHGSAVNPDGVLGPGTLNP